MSIQYLAGSLEIDNNPYDLEVWGEMVSLTSELNGYCAYKIPVLGATDSAEVPTLVIITKEHGVLLLDLVQDPVSEIMEDGRVWRSEAGLLEQSRDVVLEQYVDELEARFKRSTLLYSRRSRSSNVPVTKVVYFRENDEYSLQKIGMGDYCFSEIVSREEGASKAFSIYSQSDWGASEQQIGDALSLMEGTWDFKSGTLPLDSGSNPVTVNDFIKRSLNRTFKQDEAQRKVSMQIPNGPQRIRGLAGTGKTIVLSLKASLAALRLPKFRILYLFNTQSLYHLIESQIGNYYAKEAKAVLPQGKVDILHAWGGKVSGEGLYSKTCDQYGVRRLAFRDVPRGVDQLSYVYRDLLSAIGDDVKPVYDLVLIDEAQDFPEPVFELAYKLTKDPKRIVVAYDDFQSLSNLKIREFSELFGKDATGNLRFSSEALRGKYAGGIDKDFVLPNCYRNPRNILMVAHGVALGISRAQGVVDSVDLTADWNALGYQVNSPQSKSSIEAGDQVEVERLDVNSTNTLEQILKEQGKLPNKLVQSICFNDKLEELDHVCNKIYDLIDQQGVAPHEIYVIAMNTAGSEEFLGDVRSRLNSVGVDAISPGFVESSRHFFQEGAVVLTTPYRAKGNEANIVFVCNCEVVVNDLTFRNRNSFFVSVTRSRGWCHISGVGSNMSILDSEIKSISSQVPKFSYIRPADNEIARRRLLLSSDEESLLNTQEKLKKLAIENPELFREFVKNQTYLDE